MFQLELGAPSYSRISTKRDEVVRRWILQFFRDIKLFRNYHVVSLIECMDCIREKRSSLQPEQYYKTTGQGNKIHSQNLWQVNNRHAGLMDVAMKHSGWLTNFAI